MATTPTKRGESNTGETLKSRAMVLTSPLRLSLQRRRLRRSRSAPPALRKPIIEHYYRVDPERKVVLPGVPKHDDDWARDSHDFFNLVVLIPIIILNIMNFNVDKLIGFYTNPGRRQKNELAFADAYTGEFFEIFFYSVLLYFVVDLVWILLVPKCVKSPATIYQHHIVTMLYILSKRFSWYFFWFQVVKASLKKLSKAHSFCRCLCLTLVPWYRPELRWCMGVCMSVEVRTAV